MSTTQIFIPAKNQNRGFGLYHISTLKNEIQSLKEPEEKKSLENNLGKGVSAGN